MKSSVKIRARVTQFTIGPRGEKEFSFMLTVINMKTRLSKSLLKALREKEKSIKLPPFLFSKKLFSPPLRLNVLLNNVSDSESLSWSFSLFLSRYTYNKTVHEYLYLNFISNANIFSPFSSLRKLFLAFLLSQILITHFLIIYHRTPLSTNRWQICSRAAVTRRCHERERKIAFT